MIPTFNKETSKNLIHIIIHLHNSYDLNAEFSCSHFQQIQHLSPEGRLPGDLSSCLVFPNAALARLRARVGELGDEKGALRHAQVALHRQHSALHKQKKEKEKKIAELQQRAVDVQMLKFGQVSLQGDMK
jgi:hypothetical protein